MESATAAKLSSQWWSPIAAAIGAGVALVGLVVLVGWAADIKVLTALRTGWATMKPNTAMGFVLAGAALFLARSEGARRVRPSASSACSALVALLGLLTASEYVFGIDLGIDQLLFVDKQTPANAYPGRMSPATAVHFILMGTALLLSRTSSERLHIVVQALAILTMLSSYIAIVGYAYDLSALYSVAPYTSVALHTAVLFLTLGAGVVINEPKRGVMRLIASPYAGGRAARRLLPFALLMPPVAGWLRLEGQRAGLYETEFGVALFVVVTVVAFVAVVLSTVASLDDADVIRQQEVKFRGLLESAPDAMVIVDRGGSIALVNGETERLFGYRREELLGQPVEMLIPEGARAGHPAHRAAYLAAPRMRAMGAALDLHARRRDGTEFPVEISLSPLETDEGMLIFTAVRDITKQKRAAAELEEARRVEAVASGAKSDFLSSMSHELRTPLNAIIGFAQMLEIDRRQSLTENQKEYVGYIVGAGHHLLNLVNEVLDLAGIESGRLKLSIEHVPVRNTLDFVSSTMSPLADKAKVAFETFSDDGIADVRADNIRLRQILINLVSNAIKYNRPEGKVTLTAATAPNDAVRFSITDTGIGIAPERQKELFEPFQRLGAQHTDIEGTGIGLALTRRMIEAMNGSIGFSSTPGRGSVFWIELPVASGTGAEAVSESLSSVPPRPTASGYSLLYVEDNPASLRLMERLISTLPNVAILTAATPQLGLDLAVAHRPDIIVLDLNLPGMSGYEVLSRLKALPETCNIPVVALSAAAFPRDVKKGMAAGFFRYMTKPLDVKEFLAAIDDALVDSPARREARG